MFKKLTAVLFTLFLLCTCTALADTYARLNQSIATRMGPGTEYVEAGTYLREGDYVTVLTKAWDATNGIWWVQVEFEYDGNLYRLYTGAQRMNVNLTNVPEETPQGIVYVTRDADAWTCPDYARCWLWNDTVYRGTSAVLMEVENGYGLVECWNDYKNQPWRVWLDLDDLSCRSDYTDSDNTYVTGSNTGITIDNGSSYDTYTGASQTTGGNSGGTYSWLVGQTCRVTATSANARMGAGTQYAIVEYVFWGERYEILDTATASNGKIWYQIKKDGVICWIASGVTDMSY